MRVLIAAENASAQMGGEAFLSLYYFDRFRERHVDVWMVCHARVRDELQRLYPDDEVFQRIHFIEDTPLQHWIWKVSQSLPARIRGLITDEVIRLITQQRSRILIQRLIPQLDIQLVFDPSRISPKAPSFLYGLGVPVVIGPMAGGMNFPPAFEYLESPLSRFTIQFGRAFSQLANWLIPGKRQADALLVANDRTAQALPKGCQGQVYYVRECGVDLSRWQPHPRLSAADRPVRFICMARFVEQKGIPFLVEAFQQVAAQSNAVLELIGNGELYDAVKARIHALQLQDRVILHGWMSLEAAAQQIRECDVFVVPSIADPGNISMMEAMATGMPLITTNWGGPGEIADSTCGILVDPTSKEDLINGLAAAMIRLANSPDLRQQLAQGSLQRIRTNDFDWNVKVDRVLDIFKRTLSRSQQPVKQTFPAEQGMPHVDFET